MPQGRIVLVDIEGIPLHAWSKPTFRKIMVKWGTIVQLGDVHGDDVYKNRVCRCRIMELFLRN